MAKFTKLCIDAGHGYSNVRPGRYDTGAVAAGVNEADVCLQWAKTLKWVLGNAGVPLFLTRDDDRDPTPVGRRDDQAEMAGCSHFLSIHCNSSANPFARGVEAFYRDRADFQWATSALACAIKAVQSKDRGLKSEGQSQHDRLAVFDFDGPCTLVEIGFLTNISDRKRILDREVRIAFANALYQCVRGMQGVPF